MPPSLRAFLISGVIVFAFGVVLVFQLDEKFARWWRERW